MTEILDFKRSRSTCVEKVNDNTMVSICRLQDTLTEAFVEIKVKLPDLEITDAKGEFYRSYQKECRQDENEALKKVTGVRIGPGMLKIIKGLMGEKTDCKELIFMVEECCHGVILAFTKKSLDRHSMEDLDAIDYYKDMVKKNIRMYNRCAAFAPGSILVEGLSPPTE